MKKFVVILIVLFVITPIISLSAPNYDPNYKGYVYDVTYDVELYNYLDKEYDKKCYVQITPTLSENICGTDSYYRMVMQPYAHIKKTMEEGGLSKDASKSKKELLAEIKEDIAYYNELEEKYKNICTPKYEQYRKKVKELEDKGIFWFTAKKKLAIEMMSNGSLCSISAHDNIVYIPFHEWRMSKLRK